MQQSLAPLIVIIEISLILTHCISKSWQLLLTEPWYWKEWLKKQ